MTILRIGKTYKYCSSVSIAMYVVFNCKGVYILATNSSPFDKHSINFTSGSSYGISVMLLQENQIFSHNLISVMLQTAVRESGILGIDWHLALNMSYSMLWACMGLRWYILDLRALTFSAF